MNIKKFFYTIILFVCFISFAGNVSAQDWYAGWHSEAIALGCTDYRQSCRTQSNWSGQRELAQANYRDNPNNYYGNGGYNNRQSVYGGSGYYNPNGYAGAYNSYGYNGGYGNGYYGGQPNYNFGNTSGGNSVVGQLLPIIAYSLLNNNSSRRDDRDYDDDRSSRSSGGSTYQHAVEQCLNQGGSIVRTEQGAKCQVASTQGATVTPAVYTTTARQQGPQCNNLSFDGKKTFQEYSAEGQSYLANVCKRAGQKLMRGNTTGNCWCE